jgi:molybdopterin converting factor small subunit
VRIELALYASLQEFLPEGPEGSSGKRSRIVDLPDGITVGEVASRLGLPKQPRVSFLDGRGVTDDAPLRDGGRLAIFPPVAGG